MTASHAIALIPVLPFVTGTIIGLAGHALRERAWKLGLPAVVLSAVGSLWALFTVLEIGPVTLQLPVALVFDPSLLPLSLRIDRLSAVMMMLIAGVSTIVHLYSIRYLHGDPGFARFYALLGLTTSVLLFLVCTGNLLLLFVCWQLLSWLLYLLLAYQYTHPAACDAALKTFLVHRFGDVSFLAGVVVAYRAYGTLEFPLLFERASTTPAMLTLWQGGIEMSAATAVTLLLFVGAMAKSAQFPLHVWLPDTMDTPTPVSALMHAGIVNAGGFLLNRLAPLYGESSATLHTVFIVGGLTTILGACIMLTQNDIKKTLGFSTMGQMGYMIMECGLGAFALAIFHLIAHGLFKATLFLGSGSVIHTARREPRVPSAAMTSEEEPFPRLAWFTGFTMTLVLPLLIVLLAHGVLAVPLLEEHGSVIFLFFSWVTASQAIFSLYRLYAVASWKIAATMVATLISLVVIYLWAGITFSHFLYPEPGDVAAYFAAAALPAWLFDVLIVTATVLIVAVWVLLYATARGELVAAPSWATVARRRLYVWAINRLYVDLLYLRLSEQVERIGRRLALSRFGGWSLPHWVVAFPLALSALVVLVDGIGPGYVPPVLLVMACMVLLPVAPLHTSLTEGLARLPSLVSPVILLGSSATAWWGISVLALGELPTALRDTMAILSLASATYGSLHALAERDVKRRLAFAYVVLTGMGWWFLLLPGSHLDRVVPLLASAVPVFAGLFVAWAYLERRLGTVTLEQLGGLATRMPLFATLFTVLLMAAMGFPPFAMFLSFAALLLSTQTAPWFGGLVIGAIWFLGSWQFGRLLQDLWFGQTQFRVVSWDARAGEAFSLFVILCVAVAVASVQFVILPDVRVAVHLSVGP